ncbi:hypothetical protein ABKW28_14625 [Nocardioides sp. 31GB23]|uniref:hypothetical protein n=1 Tax=Nocardioides sp. 31GB23 TaxID=3156065 RepID=UPI0032AFAAA6
MKTTHTFPPGHPAASFLSIAGGLRLLDPVHLGWALVLMTNPIPHHLLGWAEVEVGPGGQRTLAYTTGCGTDAHRYAMPLSRTADQILLPGAGPLLDLMGAGPSKAFSLVQQLSYALRDIDGVTMTAVYAAAVCVSRLDALAPVDIGETADELVRLAGFDVGRGHQGLKI